MEADGITPTGLSYPVELAAIGGMLLIALPGGLFQVVEPFTDPVRVHRFQTQWRGASGIAPPRIAVSGPWSVLYDSKALTVLNLLILHPGAGFGLEDPGLLHWVCPLGHRLAAPPVITDCPRPSEKDESQNKAARPFDRAIVWVTTGEEA